MGGGGGPQFVQVQLNGSECGSSHAPREPQLAAHLLLDLLLLNELVVGAVQLPLQAAVPVVGGRGSPALAQKALPANRKK